METNRIIFGKDNTDKIVNIEVSDNTVELTRLIDGKLETEVRPNKLWILSTRNIENSMVRLKGDLPYKFGKQFNSFESFYNFKKKYHKYDLFTINNPAENCMVNKGITYFKGLTLFDIPVLSFDLETTTLKHTNESKILLISNTYRNGEHIIKKLFAYDEYKSQGDMIVAWCDWVRQMDPVIMLFHNGNGFDLPYLEYIADQEGISLNLGRDGSSLKTNQYESKYRIDGSKDLHYKKHKIFGREIIDTLFLAYKYDIGRRYESYGLKPIIKAEGLEKPNRTFYDSSLIRHNYKDPIEWEKIKLYCIDDSDDALALFDLMAPPFFYLATSVPKTFQALIESASGSQLNSMMIRSYLQDAHSLPRTSEAVEFEGAISNGYPGLYSNVLKIDVKSMYPNIMLQYNIYDKQKDPNRNMLAMLSYFTDERIKNKKLAKETGDKKYSHLEQSGKIFINSTYGFLGASGLLFNGPKEAALVTKYGRDIIKKTILWATGKEYLINNSV